MKRLVPFMLLLTAMAGCHKTNQDPLVYTMNESTSKAAWNGAAPDHFQIGSLNLTGTAVTNRKGEVVFNFP